MSHSCRALLCDTPHYPCECNQCEECHQWHLDDNERIIEHWAVCPYCADLIAWDIERGIRCWHGEFIPDGYVTDIECTRCLDFYDFKGGQND